MARSSKFDPIEKFRFRVTFFKVKPTINFGADGFSDTKVEDDTRIRSSFSQVILPKTTIKQISYRENRDMNRVVKQPGLVTYSPVVLRRGVLANRELYNWIKEVHNDIINLSASNEILSDFNIVPVHDPSFRREMVISVLDREGKGVKHWMCFNCFPVSYKGGNNLNANEEDILIEELEITYESYIELQGPDLLAALEDAQKEADKAALDALTAAAIGAALGAAQGLL